LSPLLARIIFTLSDLVNKREVVAGINVINADMNKDVRGIFVDPV